MKIQIGVIGAGSSDAETSAKAYKVGKAIADCGAALICGGMGGVMEEACKGAKEAGGVTIGILPTDKRGTGNRELDYEIVTNAGHARNVFIAHSADALIAVSGSYGTLSEISISLKLGKPVIGLNSWDIPGVIPVDDPELAVAKAMELIEGK
jgi:uncharacterized protein (TIGR00725 family)